MVMTASQPVDASSHNRVYVCSELGFVYHHQAITEQLLLYLSGITRTKCSARFFKSISGQCIRSERIDLIVPRQGVRLR